MKKSPEGYIYPEIHIFENEIGISLSTTLRKKHRGKWYKISITTGYFFDHIDMDTKEIKCELLQKIHCMAYNAMILGKVQIKAVDEFCNIVFPLDTNQESEESRLRKTQPK